nr:immunoglobulin light chain junction region [Macaca mulatta]MOX07477.1 immunoglobulin light chain junction region [Macaca mulatta]
CVQALDFPLTF